MRCKGQMTPRGLPGLNSGCVPASDTGSSPYLCSSYRGEFRWSSRNRILHDRRSVSRLERARFGRRVFRTLVDTASALKGPIGASVSRKVCNSVIAQVAQTPRWQTRWSISREITREWNSVCSLLILPEYKMKWYVKSVKNEMASGLKN